MIKKNKIKILSISHYTALYGANRSLLSLIEGTQDVIDWTVICRTNKKNALNPFTIKLKELGIKHHFLPYLTDIRTQGDTGFKNSSIYFIKELLINWLYAIYATTLCWINRIDYIHSNSSVFCFGAYVSFLSRKPHVWHFREFIDKDYDLRYNFGFKYLKYWADKAYKIIVISKAIQDACVVARNINAKSIIIYNGVVSQKQIPTLSSASSVSKYNLLIIGSLCEAKNQLDAIKAVQILVKKNVPVHLSIVGETGNLYYEKLLLYVKENDLEGHVSFIGYLNDTVSIFHKSHITLVCSKNEGMGRVTAESFANGIPVIGYDAAGTSELIKHRINGLLYKGDEEALAESIENLLNDAVLYNNIRIEAQHDVLEYYTMEQYSKRFLTELSSH